MHPPTRLLRFTIPTLFSVSHFGPSRPDGCKPRFTARRAAAGCHFRDSEDDSKAWQFPGLDRGLARKVTVLFELRSLATVAYFSWNLLLVVIFPSLHPIVVVNRCMLVSWLLFFKAGFKELFQQCFRQ